MINYLNKQRNYNEQLIKNILMNILEKVSILHRIGITIKLLRLYSS
jgi:hypothetical protein